MQFEDTIIMRNVAWYGSHTWSPTVAGRAAFRRACPYAGVASKKATIQRTISTCFCRKPAVRAIVVIRRWWKPKASAAITASTIVQINHRCRAIWWPWPKRLCHDFCCVYCIIFVIMAIHGWAVRPSSKPVMITAACSWSLTTWANWCEMWWRKRCWTRRWVDAFQLWYLSSGRGSVLMKLIYNDDDDFFFLMISQLYKQLVDPVQGSNKPYRECLENCQNKYERAKKLFPR